MNKSNSNEKIDDIYFANKMQVNNQIRLIATAER